MPFCTACGHAEPRRRTVLLAVRHPAGRGRSSGATRGASAGPATSPRRSRFGAAATTRPTTSDRQLNPADAAAVDALPAGHALLVVQRGPGRRQPLPARHRPRHGRAPPRQRHLPRRRHRLPPARGVPPRRRRFTVSDVGSLNGTYVNRDRIDDVAAAGRRRGADRQVPAGLLRRARRRELTREAVPLQPPGRG